MKKKALLIIGDQRINRKRIEPSLKQFIDHAQKFKDKQGIELKIISYAQLLSGKALPVEANLIKVVFFFPYLYWNRNIETYRDGRAYGDQHFGRAFKLFFRKVERAINRYYQGKKIEYLNSPRAYCVDRDKKISKDILQKSAIPVPRLLKISSLPELQRCKDKGVSLYIKPRFGAMGKGITYLDQQGVVSNFLFRKGRLISRPYDYNWKFSRIRDEHNFLDALLQRKVICEEAIKPAVFRGKRFDFRIYVVFNKVVYLYAKFSPADSCVTNWTQGGKIDKRKSLLKTISKKRIAALKKLAKQTAQALGLNFVGIDIIFSQDLQQAYVLEGNAFPGYEKGFDLMKCLIKSLLK